MNQLVDEIFEVQIEDIADYEFPIGYLFGLITYYNNVKYEFLIHLKEKSERIIFCGSGALDLNKNNDRTRPHFNRWSWSESFTESIIYYNDPTLYIHNEIFGGWGVGTKDDYYLKNIAKISELFAKNQNMSNDKLLFYGSSAAGFTSFMLSTLVKDSCSICDIPQFYLNELWSVYWEKFKEHIFTNMTDEEIFNEFGYRINIFEMMKKENYIPKSILILDCTAERDFDLQYTHFFKDLNKLPFNKEVINNNIKIIINGKFEGHAPLSKIETVYFVENSKFLLDSCKYKVITRSEHSELIELRKFKHNFLKSIGITNDEFLDNYFSEMTKKYEQIYNDLINERKPMDYKFNLRAYSKVKDSEYFDADFYTKEYNLRIPKEYAILHYLDVGFKEGKDPSANFYGDSYLNANSDVKNSGMNPLVHYELYGKNEGRLLPNFRI